MIKLSWAKKGMVRGGVCTRRSEDAILHGCVGDLKCFGATWFFQVCGHAANSLNSI